MVGPRGFVVALAAVIWVFAGSAGAEAPDPRATTHIIDFPDCCPRPAWWDDVEVEVRIDSMEVFLSVWQDKALTDQQKAKALFQAIEDFLRSNDDITAAAVNYFYWVGRDYDRIRKLYEFGVGRYLDYDRPLQNYGGKVGDMSDGMVNNLAKLYLLEGTPERAVPWLQYILDRREADVNDHILKTTAAHLGDALNRLGRGPEAIEVLLAARRDYGGDWEKLLDDELAKVRSSMGWSYYLHDQRLTRLLLAAGLVAFLAVYVLRRQRRQRG
ncbi:MAG TPA: hypothetical protein VMY41_02330 [Thermohalobaculum sp.]|nr:hypothetical protein [Thermohalobaculum sp.]